MAPRILSAACALVALAGLTSSAFAIKPFSLVEDGYPEVKGILELENTFSIDHNLAFDHGFTQYSLENELEYGLTDNFTVRAKLAYNYVSATQQTDEMSFDAFGIETQYYFTNPNVDSVGYSLITAVETGENSLTGVAIFVAQKDWDKWIGAVNLGAELGVDNTYHSGDKETALALTAAAGLAYKVDNAWKIGGNASYTLNYAEARHYEGSTLYAGPTVNWIPADNVWVTAGANVKVFGADDDAAWNVTLICGIYLN